MTAEVITPTLPMLSFASIGEIERVEGKPEIAVCEVEKIDIKDSRPEDADQKPKFKAYISIDQIIKHVGAIQEGDILVVSHEDDEVITIIRKDDAEKERRIELLRQLEAAIFV